MFLPDVENLKNNVVDLRRRLDGCRDRGNGSLALVSDPVSGYTLRSVCVIWTDQ